MQPEEFVYLQPSIQLFPALHLAHCWLQRQPQLLRLMATLSLELHHRQQLSVKLVQ